MNKKKLKHQIMKQEVKLTNEILIKIKREEQEKAFKRIIPVALLALRDAEGYGEKRLLRFYDKLIEINKDMNAGLLDIYDIEETILKEVNIKFV